MKVGPFLIDCLLCVHFGVEIYTGDTGFGIESLSSRGRRSSADIAWSGPYLFLAH